MADFPPPGGPGAPGGSAPSGGPAPGWWQASDGNWYPPDQQPGYAPPAYGAPPPYGAPAPYGYGYQVQPARPTNGWAIASLVVSLVSCGFGSILGVIFGHVAMSQIKRNGDQGRGLAIAGLIIGYLGLLAVIGFVVLVIVAGETDNSGEFQFDFESLLGWVG